MTVAAPPLRERLLALFLDLERQARAAGDTTTLAYSLVNDSQALLRYRHAALLIGGKVRALTGISVIEPNAPFVAFVERAAAQLEAAGLPAEPTPVDPARLDDGARADWQALSAPHALWLPLSDRHGQRFGGLWLAREEPWSELDRALLAQLADCYAHAWLALQPRPWRLRWPHRRVLGLASLVLALALLPVRQSVLAPAEVIPLDGQVIAAPLDGVIAEFLVKPNDNVRAGDILLRFDATAVRARAEVADHALAVAEAELKAHTQRAFSDTDAGARIDLLKARVEQKRAERDYARDLLARTEPRAERDGIAVFADAQRWIGRPVQTGERLLEIADPDQAALRIDLAVADALDFKPGTEVALFLDSDPLKRHPARLERLGYEAQPNAAGQLAYRLDAKFSEAAPRIGLRGTAKLYGERGPLLVYLLRRPLAALRQGLGL